MKLIEQIEFWHNKASDTKFVWFPFNFLKPEPNVKIDLKLKIQIIICFGLYYEFFATIRRWLFSGLEVWTVAVQGVMWAVLFFAIWFNVVTAPLWNMRAKRFE